MTEPHEDPRIRETEPSTETGGPLDPTTSSLDEMVDSRPDPAGGRDVEEVTNSGDAREPADSGRGEP